MEDQDKPLVTIITVCLNSEKTIERTIKSVVNQTYSNIEYIIIDGKSTDRTLDIIAKYKDEISIFVSANDKGIYDAMNKGLKLATGELIGIINSDDWYELDAVETIVNTFLEDRTAQIFYGPINVYENDKFIEIRYPSALTDLRIRMPHPSVFINSEIYKRYGFNIKYKKAADYDLISKLHSKNYKFTYINRTIANYRVGGFRYVFNPIKGLVEDTIILLHYSHNFRARSRIFLLFLLNLKSIICAYFSVAYRTINKGTEKKSKNG